MNHALLGHVMTQHAAASAFRSYVGYPLFGSAFQTLWPLFLIPLLAAHLGERVAAALPPTPRAWIPAALLAAVPGLLALGELWLVMTPTILGPIVDWRGWLLMWIAPGIGLALTAYALVRALLRGIEMHRLFHCSAEPGPRLRQAAEALGLRARELPTQEKECFVAGVIRPTVYISHGALTRLGDAELRAALLHERAHVQGRDTLLLFLLSFLCDLAPIARRRMLETYQAAREAAADQAAASGAGRLNLASALLALARPGPAQGLPMAKAETLRWRLQAILQDGKAPPAPWYQASLGLLAATLLLAWPLLQVQLHDVFCWY